MYAKTLGAYLSYDLFVRMGDNRIALDQQCSAVAQVAQAAQVDRAE